MPNVKYFPYDTLEAQASTPERWEPSPNSPSDHLNDSINGNGIKNNSADPDYETTSSHITVPKLTIESDPTRKIDLSTALQYGLAAGYPPLLSFIAQFTREVIHPSVPYKDGPGVVLNCGATDGFSKTLQLLVDPWTQGVDPVAGRPGMICETFVFGNILTQVRPLGVQVVPVELDGEGMLAEGPGGLREVLENWDSSKGRRPHLLYTVT